MTTHEPELVWTSLQELSRAQRNVIMGRAVEAVAAHALFVVKIVWQAIEIGISRQRVMECGVKDGYLWDGGEKPPHLANAGNIYGIVQRRERIERLDLRKHL